MARPSPSITRRSSYFARQAADAARRVTQAHRQEYARTGVTKVSKVVSPFWIDWLERACQVAQQNPGPFAETIEKSITQGGIYFTDLEMARRLPLFADFNLHRPTAAVAGAVMQSKTVRYLYDQLFIKGRGISTRTPWHQDGGYWSVQGQHVTTVFVPLNPVQAHEGLYFIKGSHQWPLYNPQHFADESPYRDTLLPPMPDIDSDPALQESLLKFDLQPGDVLVFSARIVHGGPDNWGHALSTRWVGDDATFWHRLGEGGVPTFDTGLCDGDPLWLHPAFPRVV